MALTYDQAKKIAKPDVVFRIIVGADPEYPAHRKAAMVVKDGELWFSLAGDVKDWSKRKQARAIYECCMKIVEDYCKKEMI